MRRQVLIFHGAVIIPSAVLGLLALGALQGQEALLERQRSRLYETAAEQTSRSVATRIDELQREFSLRVESLIGKEAPGGLAAHFDERLRQSWPWANVGFAVTLPGKLLSPFVLASAEARQFLVRNEGFLCQQDCVEVFAVTPKGRINLSELDPLASPSGTFLNKDGSESKGAPARFVQLVADAQEGVVSRFIDDQLSIWVWYRTPRDPEIVFGAQLDRNRLRADLAKLIQGTAPPAPGAALGLIDDRNTVVNTSPQGIRADWRQSTVTRLVGDALPHWSVAVMVHDPSPMLADSRRLRVIMATVILLLLGAIALGGWIVITDIRRQLDLARKKSDFVSNVSHEFRTPLTSIRLFAEMLATGRITDETKRRQHLGVIQAEASRLQRLISNVLDFSRLERGESKLRHQPVDLGQVTAEVMESFEPQFTAENVVPSLDRPASPVPVQGDRDALAQIVNNLLTNTLKYAAQGGEVLVRLSATETESILEVMDRGPGVPWGSEERIFEQFYRCHDALSSGIQGAGLGLTLARRLARAQGGDVNYRPREGGGSCFRFRLPLAKGPLSNTPVHRPDLRSHPTPAPTAEHQVPKSRR